MPEPSHLQADRLILSNLLARLGPDASQLAPFFDNPPDFAAMGEGWERRYAQWWADLFAIRPLPTSDPPPTIRLAEIPRSAIS